MKFAARARILILALCLTGQGGAAGLDVVSPDFLMAWGLYQSGKLQQAADLWTEYAVSEPQGDDPAGIRGHAIASVMAAVALEKLESSKAYERWADAIRLYLTANTTWEQERLLLAQRAEIWRDAVRRDSDAGIIPGSMDILLMELDANIDLRNYNGPRPGLSATGANQFDDLPGNSSGYVEMDPAVEREASAGESRHAGLMAPALEPNKLDQPDVLGAEGPQYTGTDVVTAENVVEQPEEESKQPASFSMAIIPESQPDQTSPAVTTESMEQPGNRALALPAGVVSNPELRKEGGREGIPDYQAYAGQWASVAWSYFRSNRQSSTGMINGKSGYAFATIWDMANMLAGEISANQLGLNPDDEFHDHMSSILTAIENLPLVQQSLPNREYDIRTLQMVDIEGRLSAEGSGWSAVDIGRLLVWLRITGQYYPDYRDRIARIAEGWNFGPALRAGRLQATLSKDGKFTAFQEGRWGDEQYAAAGYALFDMVPVEALNYLSVKRHKDVHGFLMDSRQPALVTGDPFFLAVMELGGIDSCFREGARQQWDAQITRSRETGRAISWSEDSIGQAPWYVFSSIRAGEDDWVVASYDRKARPDLANYSFKAALAWNTVFPTAGNAIPANLPERLVTGSGFRSGVFEDGRLNDTVTLSTNAIVLETLWYLQRRGKPFFDYTNPVTFSCPPKPE